MAWIDQDPDPVTRAELADLVDRVEKADASAEAQLSSRFSGHLTFGTAGLRAEIGAGPQRMNRVVVSHAAAGLGAFLHQHVSDHTPSVVIGYDARHNSDVFAHDTATVLQGMGINAILFDQYTPTPVLAFALRYLGADAGVMVTASHNPPADNGYKVYLGGADGGSQIVPPNDADIHAAIMTSHTSTAATALARSEDVDTVGSDVISAYIDATLAVADGFEPAGRGDLRICYTPLHGVGADVFVALLRRAGFDDIHVVDAQVKPDPDFPTVSFPNPEEAGALDLAMATADQVGADLIIAHDPDADRLAIALPQDDGSGWTMLSGNELGAVLASTRASQAENAGQSGVIGYSLVSSPIASAIARQHGLTPVETPTGFKWISRLPGLVFGFEEALGYLVNPETVRDKDGISAGLFFASLAAWQKNHSRTIWDVLDDLRATYGGFGSGQISLRFDSMAIAGQVMDSVRAATTETFSSLHIDTVTDLLHPSGDMPATNLIALTLGEGDRVIIRPSGTEPKLKVYLDCLRPTQDEASSALQDLQVALQGDIDALVSTLAGG
jgi:phosphomannomutase